MYKLIADSGSTKTDWVLLKNGNVIKEISTIGFNPYFQTKDQISLEILNNLKPELSEVLSHINEIYYYGAGCSTFENCALIEDTLTNTLNVRKILVAHDLLAAARALCKKEKGIACILGTGSNSCLYNGKHIIENVPSVGYLWGDHGSGAQIGKYFIRDYFENKLPQTIRKAFEKEGYEREKILNNVYKNIMPSKYLAGISKFIAKYKESNYVNDLLKECLNSFFEYQINQYEASKKYTVSTVGSIGFVYADVFKEVAEQQGYSVGTVIKSPIEGLVEFHAAKG
ncbi:MAG: ATPase [Bacteroidetes bacterium]|nr:ATPase [Bacteroidota bacterium]